MLRKHLSVLAMLLPTVINADDAMPVPESSAGVAIPATFTKNETLSVGGQDVFEYIKAGTRDLVAITPAIRQRSIGVLLDSGYADYCRGNAETRILFHRRHSGITWFIVKPARAVHIVLSNASPHIAHFRQEVEALCVD